VTKSTVFCSAAQRNFGIANKKKHRSLCQPRSEKVLNCEQKRCILFRWAAKILESRPKALYFVQSRSEIFLELRTKALYFVRRAAESLET
jgi:hypothetical protein